MARSPIKTHSNSIYEKRWHLCDLRKELFAHGAVERPILKKTDRVSHDFGKKQNHFVNSIWSFFLPCFRSLNVLYKHLDGLGLLLGSSKEGQ